MYAKRDGVGGDAYGIVAFFARYQVAKIISEHGAAYTNSCSCCYILPMVGLRLMRSAAVKAATPYPAMPIHLEVC